MTPTKPVPGLSAAAAAAALGAAFDELRSPRRGCRRAARARQFAVYLDHVALGASLSACGRVFGRTRATVRHACARIEDLRDDPRFELGAGRLEAALVAHRDMIGSLLAGGAS